MKLLPLLLLTPLAAAAQDSWLRLLGGSPALHAQLLRLNNSIPIISPGITLPPHSVSDHFCRLRVSPEAAAGGGDITVVPTTPHPPPVPGYYALNGTAGVHRLVLAWQAAAAPGLERGQWRVDQGRLRWGPNATGPGQGQWVAVRGVTWEDVPRWDLWWVVPGEASAAELGDKSYLLVDLEVVDAEPGVNS